MPSDYLEIEQIRASLADPAIVAKEAFGILSNISHLQCRRKTHTGHVMVTGVCFVLAGLAILTGILDVLAAWLLGLMFLVFNLTILPTYIFAHPKNHAAWGGNAYNLAAVGSSWILAEVIASRRSGGNTP